MAGMTFARFGVEREKNSVAFLNIYPTHEYNLVLFGIACLP
jgi:hypothetical protein